MSICSERRHDHPSHDVSVYLNVNVPERPRRELNPEPIRIKIRRAGGTPFNKCLQNMELILLSLLVLGVTTRTERLVTNRRLYAACEFDHTVN